VRNGGFAAVVHPQGEVEVLLPLGPNGELEPLGWWALASLDLAPPNGAVDGVDHARTTLDADRANSVLDWCDRDAVHPGPRRTMTLDCVSCTACCQDAHVILEAADVERLAPVMGDRALARLLARDPEGRLHLAFVDHRCPNLGASGCCRVYAWRPEACRAFPMASEPCLAARAETLGLCDDVAEHEPHVEEVLS
jgi:Fe-S-cluster containining protein